MLNFQAGAQEKETEDTTNKEPEAENTLEIKLDNAQNVPEDTATQVVDNVVNLDNPYKEVLQKKEKPTKPHRPRNVKANIFIIISLIIILFAGAFGYMLLNKSDFPFIMNLMASVNDQINNGGIIPTEPDKPVVPEEPVIPQEPAIDPEEVVEYINPSFEFSISHRAKATLIEPGSFDTQLETYLITYSGKLQEGKITSAENVFDGYMVAITVHKDIINKDVDEITLEKRNRYIISCDDSANTSGITDKTIANRTAKTFTVENCGANFIQSFFVRGNDLYEFTQVYRGDIGIRQVYKTETDEIVDWFKIINTIQPTPINTWEEYTTLRDFTFKFPTGLDSTCCTLRGPISETARKVVVMADPKSLAGSQGTLFNGFAVYTDRLGDITYNDYLENQKKLLTENYEVIIGKKPLVSEETLKVAGVDAVRLRGYAWWGDLVLFSYPNSESVGIFVLTELDPGSFEGTFKEILSTVKF